MVSKPRPKNYHCSYEGCTKAYLRPALLKQHERTHTNERPFVCDVEGCGKAFFRKSHLQVHKESHKAGEEKLLHCDICGKGVNAPHILKRHKLTHTKQFKCPYEGCNESFYHYQNMKYHVNHVHKQVNVCDICNRRFQNTRLLGKHKQLDHGIGEAFLCTVPGCFSTFASERARHDHIRVHHPNALCSVCGTVCESETALNLHMLTHKDTNKRRKTDLPIKLSSLQSIQRHESAVVSVVEDEEEQEPLSQVPNGNLISEIPENKSIIKMLLGNFAPTYKCEVCSKTFERHHAYVKHVQKHETEKVQSEHVVSDSDLDLSAAEEEIDGDSD